MAVTGGLFLGTGKVWMVANGGRQRPPHSAWGLSEGCTERPDTAQVSRHVYPCEASKNPGKPPYLTRRRYFEAVP